jgi:pilus assembly protein Flp/PilA
MNRITKGVRRFVREDDGAAVAEYGLLLAIVAVGLIAILATFRDNLSTWFTNIKTRLLENPEVSGPAPAPTQ